MYRKNVVYTSLVSLCILGVLAPLQGCSSGAGASALETAAKIVLPIQTDEQIVGGIDAIPRVNYKPIGKGKFKLNEDLTVNTARFGPITLTKGYESDGSSSPITDTEATRIAGFIHDALYAASGHLRFANGYPESWTREQADDEYCDLMIRWKVAATHQAANCLGVKSLPGIENAWKRLEKKRIKRWKSWREQQ